MRPVLLEQVEERRWRVTIEGRALPSRFASEHEAREAGSAEGVRLDGIARALLIRVRRGLNRKRTCRT